MNHTNIEKAYELELKELGLLQLYSCVSSQLVFNKLNLEGR